jgi:hypothetical protein
MNNTSLNARIDFIGITASTLCAVHCAITPLLLSILPLIGAEFLDNPMVEYTLIFSSMTIAIVSMSMGFFRHHRKILPALIMIGGFGLILISRIVENKLAEIILSASGGLSIALSHYINWQSCKACYCCK